MKTVVGTKQIHKIMYTKEALNFDAWLAGLADPKSAYNFLPNTAAQKHAYKTRYFSQF